MARFEDSPGLFGGGNGFGTTGKITCGWCGTKYPEGDSDDEITHFADFGDLKILECCFEKVEKAILAHISDIIPWFIRILRARRRDLLKKESAIHELDAALSEFFRDQDLESSPVKPAKGLAK